MSGGLPPTPGAVALPAEYGELLDQVKTEIRTIRLRAAQAANNELVGLYWRVGRLILDRQATEGWSATAASGPLGHE